MQSMPPASASDRVDAPGPARAALPGDFARGVAEWLWIWIVSVPVLGALGFASGVRLSWLTLVLGALVATAVAALSSRAMGTEHWARRVAAAVGVAACVTALALVAAWRWYDTSYDGQNYHQEAVFALARGWNPLLDPPLEPPLQWTWVNHYPTAAWVGAAATYLALPWIELSKAPNFVLFAATLASVLALGLRLGWSRRLAWMVALVAAANPIIVMQATTRYVDGQLGAALTSLGALMALLLLGARGPGPVAAVALAAAYAANLKFTGLAFCGVFALAGALALLHARRELRPRVGAAVVSALMLAGLLGYHPYVSNVERCGHPFAPLYGSCPADIMAATRGLGWFKDYSWLERVGTSLFSPTVINVPAAPSLKIPFSVSVEELGQLSRVDARFGGFGPWFGGVALLAAGLLPLLARALWRRPKERFGVLLAAGGLACSVAIHPEAWWARYVPQLWLLPLLVFAAAAWIGGRRLRIAGWVGLALLLADAAITGGAYLRHETMARRSIRKELTRLASAGRPIEVTFGAMSLVRLRLEEAAVPYREVPALACEPTARLHLTSADYCEP